MIRRPWKRLATLRARRRRGLELPQPARPASPDVIPPFEPPDDDREFVHVTRVGFRTPDPVRPVDA